MALAVASYLLLASEEVAENIVGLVGQVSDARTSHRFLLLESVWRMYESVGSWLGHGWVMDYIHSPCFIPRFAKLVISQPRVDSLTMTMRRLVLKADCYYSFRY